MIHGMHAVSTQFPLLLYLPTLLRHPLTPRTELQRRPTMGLERSRPRIRRRSQTISYLFREDSSGDGGFAW